MKVILCDFGNVYGVRENGESIDGPLIEDIASKFDVPIKFIKENFEGEPLESYQKGKITDEEFWKSFARKIDADLPSSPEELRELWTKNFGYLGRELMINKSIEKVLEKAKKVAIDNGEICLLALFSNTIEPHAEWSDKNCLYSPFKRELRSLSPNLKTKKPEIQFYLLSAEGSLKFMNERYGTKKISFSDFFVIDDVDEYVRVGRYLGMRGFHYKSNTPEMNSQLEKEVMEWLDPQNI
jgi:hypothetical protein